MRVVETKGYTVAGSDRNEWRAMQPGKTYYCKLGDYGVGLRPFGRQDVWTTKMNFYD